MKILRHTHHQLILRIDPYGQIVFGLFFIFFSLLLAYFLCRTTVIACQRQADQQVTCTTVERLLNLVEVGRRTLSQVQEAEVRKNRASNGSTTYRVVLIAANGDSPLTSFSSSGHADKAALAEEINTFLTQGQQSEMTWQVDFPWLAMLIIGLFGLAGLWVILISQTITLGLDKGQQLILLEKTSLMGKQLLEHRLVDLEEIYVESHRSRKGRHTYKVVIRMTSGETIPLSNVSTSSSRDKQKIVDLVQGFLNPSNRDMMSANIEPE